MKLYKNTEWQEIKINGEFKDIPNDWNIESLLNLCDVRDGTHDSPKFFQTGVPFVTTKNLINGSIDFSTVKYITEKDHLNFIRRSKVDVGDILTGMIGTIGNPVLVRQKPFDFSIKNIGLIKSKGKINQEFLFSALKKYLEQKPTNNGGVIKFMKLSELRSIEFFYPYNNEQNAIASLLSKQESIVQKTKNLIASIEKRNQFMVDELLSGRLRVKEKNGQPVFYRNPDDNWKSIKLNGIDKLIPKEWEKEIISKNIKFSLGSTPSKTGDNYNGDIPWITISDLKQKNIQYFTAKIKKQKNTKVLQAGTLIGSFKMSVGKFGFTTKESATNEAIIAISPKDTIHNLNYLYHVLPQTFLQNAIQNAQGVLLLNTTVIKSLEIVTCSVDEQNKLAELLNSLAEEKEKYKQILEKEEKTFTFLLEELMSGRLRIKI